MKDQTVSVKNVITFAGAFIAFLIGSGFATGQEVLQYFASYGYSGMAGVIVTFVLLLFAGVSFITAGEKEKFAKGSDIFRYYCGNTIGTLFDYFSILFIYMSFIVMISGAGATFQQHFGMPVYVGAIIMAFLACFTVIFGLTRIVEVIGKIGPVIIIISIVLGLITIFNNLEGFSKASIKLSEMDLIKASTNWFFAAGSYAGFCMLWLAGFLSSMGAAANSRKEAAQGAAVGAISFSIAVLIVALALFARIEDVAGSEIPFLILVERVHPLLANMFSLIIVSGIYTTAVPLLWSVTERFTKDRSPRFRILAVVLAVAGFFVGIYLPFSSLVNVVYVINGYVGVILLLFMVFKTLKDSFRPGLVEQKTSTFIK